MSEPTEYDFNVNVTENVPSGQKTIVDRENAQDALLAVLTGLVAENQELCEIIAFTLSDTYPEVLNLVTDQLESLQALRSQFFTLLEALSKGHGNLNAGENSDNIKL